jgi:hypothetical protein
VCVCVCVYKCMYVCTFVNVRAHAVGGGSGDQCVLMRIAQKWVNVLWERSAHVASGKTRHQNKRHKRMRSYSTCVLHKGSLRHARCKVQSNMQRVADRKRRRKVGDFTSHVLEGPFRIRAREAARCARAIVTRCYHAVLLNTRANSRCRLSQPRSWTAMLHDFPRVICYRHVRRYWRRHVFHVHPILVRGACWSSAHRTVTGFWRQTRAVLVLVWCAALALPALVIAEIEKNTVCSVGEPRKPNSRTDHEKY